MVETSNVAFALSRLEGVSAELSKTVDAADLDRRRQLIALRRDLADCFAELDRNVDLALSGGKIGPELASEYHSQFSTVRRAVSMHQAEWPTVLIADDMSGYVTASQALRGKREAFFNWIKTALLPKIGAR